LGTNRKDDDRCTGLYGAGSYLPTGAHALHQYATTERPFPTLTTHVRPDRERVVVALRGELDLANVGDVEQEVQALYGRDFPTVVLDLRGLSFIDSTGLRLLLRLEALASSERRSFSIADGNGPARRLLELTGLGNHFETTRV
jgi:anti-sigma B factor antagonist